MTQSDDQLASSPGWSMARFFWPKFRFMKHDRWANVLFLHWRVPQSLEGVLESHAAPFRLDWYDGSAWIGLILLTEESVGPVFPRSSWTCVTHHGINVRTYVRGGAIHFASLECDDEFTSWGANFFGMPYRVARMIRSFGYRRTNDKEKTRCYRIQSKRLDGDGTPSVIRALYHAVLQWWKPRTLHSTRFLEDDDSSPKDSNAENRPQESSSSSTFAVDCSWSHSCNTPQPNDDSSSFSEWACERYHVYTHQYGTAWKGTVDHDPWPMVPNQNLCLENLTLRGIETYEPRELRPLLEHMAKHEPDNIGFSPGVGPVDFQMLQPVAMGDT